jgi:hypothetical protein
MQLNPNSIMTQSQLIHCSISTHSKLMDDRRWCQSGSLCRVVFALGQAKFCVFASTIRIAR